jgi:hypothetical protein
MVQGLERGASVGLRNVASPDRSSKGLGATVLTYWKPLPVLARHPNQVTDNTAIAADNTAPK